MRVFFGAVLILGALTVALVAESIFLFAVENNFSWTLSKLLPWMLVLVTGLFGSILLSSLITRRVWKRIHIVSTPLILLGFMFGLNPIYAGEFTKNGVELDVDSHELIDILNDYKPGFEGLVAVVDYNCPFCRKVTEGRLQNIYDRNEDLDLVLTLNTSDSITIENYTRETNSEKLNYVYHEPSSELLNLIEGVFPTFIFVKQGKILHKWKNSQLGFPAIDWIESKLK